MTIQSRGVRTYRSNAQTAGWITKHGVSSISILSRSWKGSRTLALIVLAGIGSQLKISWTLLPLVENQTMSLVAEARSSAAGAQENLAAEALESLAAEVLR
jgi:hypothetical protein